MNIPTRQTNGNSGRAYGGIAQQQRKAERRAKLLEAATRLYGSQGYAATTMKGICAEAKLTERYFYESFNNTEELLCAAYVQEANRLREKMHAAIQAAPQQPELRARIGLGIYFQGITESPTRARLLLIEITGVCARGDQLYYQDMQQSAAELLSLVLSEGRQPPAGLSATLLSRGYMGAVYQLAREWVLGDCQESAEVLVRHCMALFLGLLQQWQSDGSQLNAALTKD